MSDLLPTPPTPPTPPTSVPDIMTIDEAATYLRLRRTSCYVYARQGRLPARRVGKHWLFSRRALQAWVEAVPPLPPPRRVRRKAMVVAIGLWLVLQGTTSAASQTGTASWYSTASCQREGMSGIMANGRRLDDTARTAASWFYPLGTPLVVCRAPRPRPVHGQRPCTTVVVSDRGPAKRLVRQGRLIDLSKHAFEALAPLSVGVIAVTIEPLRKY